MPLVVELCTTLTSTEDNNKCATWSSKDAGEGRWNTKSKCFAKDKMLVLSYRAPPQYRLQTKSYRHTMVEVTVPRTIFSFFRN